MNTQNYEYSKYIVDWCTMCAQPIYDTDSVNCHTSLVCQICLNQWADYDRSYNTPNKTTNACILISEGSFSSEISYCFASDNDILFINDDDILDLNYYFQWATHIVLSGGEDIHPAWYGQKNTHSHVTSLSRRDRLDLSLAKRALKHSKPILGICRGHQALAVAAGAPLFQDIKLNLGIAHSHDFRPHSLHTKYRINTMSDILADAKYVNSLHHQSVAFAPNDFDIIAVSTDNIIEAIHHKSKPAIGVQFHPELLSPQHPASHIFDYFIDLK